MQEFPAQTDCLPIMPAPSEQQINSFSFRPPEKVIIQTHNNYLK